MKKESTILLRKDVIEMLKKAKDNPGETYNDLIEKILRLYIKLKEKDQYDTFLHEIQKPKMKEIWDNEHDSAWEKV